MKRGVKLEAGQPISIEISDLEGKLGTERYRGGCSEDKFKRLLKRFKCDDKPSYETISRFVMYDEIAKRFSHIKWKPEMKITNESKIKTLSAIESLFD